VVVCERFTVCVRHEKVLTHNEGEEENVTTFPEQGNGVRQEVAAWAEGLRSGKRDPRQAPEEGLRDLEVVSDLSLQFWEGGGVNPGVMMGANGC